jgi:hypothetical protein
LSEIDPNTGLPLVPEDYFWRVLDKHWEWNAKIPPKVNLMRHVELKHTHRGRHWWQPSYVVDESYDQVAYSQRTKDGKLTKETILDAAEEIMQWWADAKARQKLVGDYPPKKLES